MTQEHQKSWVLRAQSSGVVLTDGEPSGRGVPGAALAAGDAAAPVSVPGGAAQHPVSPRTHGAQRRGGQHATRRAAPTAGFREGERGGGGDTNKEKKVRALSVQQEERSDVAKDDTIFIDTIALSVPSAKTFNHPVHLWPLQVKMCKNP